MGLRTKLTAVLVCFFVLFSGFIRLAFSRSLSISVPVIVVAGENEIILNASVSGFASSEAVFIKGVFFKEGSGNYFGKTKSGDKWIKASDPIESQLKVNLSDWDKSLIIKSDFEDTGFNGPGDYKLKAGYYYYNSNGNLSSVNWSENILTLFIATPVPTTTPFVAPVATVTPIPTPTPSPSIAAIAKIKTPTPTPLKTLIVKLPTPASASTAVISATAENLILDKTTLPEMVLSSSTESGSQKNIKITSIVLILLGFALTTCGTVFLIKTVKDQENDNDI